MMITLGEMLDLTRTSGNEPLDTGDEEVTGDEKEPVVNCSGYINGELFFAVVTRMNARLKEAHEKAVEAEKRIEDLVEQLEELQERMESNKEASGVLWFIITVALIMLLASLFQQ